MKHSKILLIFPLILILLLPSCVMQQGISLTNNQNGWSTTDLSVSDFFVAVLDDFLPFSDEIDPKPILEASIEEFVGELNEVSSTSGITSLKLDDNTYFIDFTFTSLTDLLRDLNNREDQSLVTMTKANARQTLKFYLDLENYPELARIVPFLTNENFETFGPLYNEGMNAEEYYEMIGYILGEEGPEAIKESVISLRFTAPNSIIEYEGGVLEGKNVIRFDIPLIDFLLLSSPITFYATW